MAKRSSRRSSGGGVPSGQRLLLVVVGILVLGILYVAQQSLGIDLGLGGTGEGDSGETTGGEETPGGAGETTGGGEEVSGSGDYYTVYFTDPVIPFDDVTTGGIEKNLIALIDGAQTSIVGATFEFNLQNVADALIAAHNRGVQVRMVYDNEHTEEDPQMAQMIAAGIPATPDERSAFMHNKFFVIDGQVVWLGSWNVSINDSYRNNNNAIVIRSTKLAENYSTEFEEMFAGEFGPTSPENTPNPSFTLNGIRIESYFASEDPVEDRLVEMVRAAQQSVHFMAFSFTDDGLAQAMLDRAAAGVEVLGIFEQRGSDTESSSCGPLRGAELDVRIDSNPRTFHHKVVIVDGAVVSIGSFNFSANAAESNDENLIIVHDPNVAALYEQEFNKWFAQSQQPPGSTCDLP